MEAHFDLSTDLFPWREPIPHEIETRRAHMSDLLIFDILLSSGGNSRRIPQLDTVVVRLPPLSIFHFQLYIILSWTFTWPYTLAIWTFRALYSPFNHIRHTRYFGCICPPTSDTCARPPPIGLDPQLIDIYLVPVSPFIIATRLASIRLPLASTISTLFNRSRFHQS